MSDNNGSILKGTRIYLSGPMDFLLAREQDKQAGWRSRIRQFLKPFEAHVYDPWSKPVIVGQDNYGQNYEYSSKIRSQWTFENSEDGQQKRAELCHLFYPTVHINMRTVDICDFLIAYCPTNVYSVGTVNEIIRARSQNKPVLLVSPSIEYPAMDKLIEHLKQNGDAEGLTLLDQLKNQAYLKSNSSGTPSPWYLGVLPEDYFFDGFGFNLYPQLQKENNWIKTQLDEVEEKHMPLSPLLPYLEKLNKEIPKRYDRVHKDYIENSDWLILKPSVHDALN
jgi:hypothetical protein